MHRSVAPSQIASGKHTPRKDEAGTDSSLSSPLYSAQLQERLRQVDGDSKTAAASNRNRIVHSIEVLDSDRRKTSELAREQALAVLLREATSKYDPALMSFNLFSAIVQSYTTSRSSVEAMTALQLICAATPLAENSDDVRADDCLDLAKQLTVSLSKQFDNDTKSVDVRQSMVTAFSCITYYLNAGGGGYGVESIVGKLMESAESQVGESAEVASAAIGGATLLTTLTSGGTTASIATYWLYSLVPILEGTHLPSKLAAAKFLAVIIERCPPEILVEEQDNIDALEDILSTLEGLTQETKTASKRDRKAQNLLFKSVLRFAQSKLGDKLSGEGETTKLSEDEDEEENAVSQYHKNTVRKSMGISTWSALIVVEHLMWVYGPGLHLQLSVNPSIQQLLKKEELRIDSQGYEPENEEEEQSSAGKIEAHKVNEVQKAKDIRKGQLRKAEENGLAM